MELHECEAQQNVGAQQNLSKIYSIEVKNKSEAGIYGENTKLHTILLHIQRQRAGYGNGFHKGRVLGSSFKMPF